MHEISDVGRTPGATVVAAQGTTGQPEVDHPPRTSHARWVVCALLFFATTINYVDRGVLGVLANDLQKTIGWTETQYGDINGAFTLAYALGFLVIGRLNDRLGTKLCYAVSLVVWSLAAAGHALAHSALGFGIARFFLGLGEAGNFPSAIKTTAEWFPRRERALATGIFNAGSNIGPVLVPWLVPILATAYGWQSAFVVTGLVGLVWVAFWIPLYHRPEDHPRISAAELAWIRGDQPEPATPVPWLQLFPHRQTWAFAAGKFLTDAIWWFYLFWTPKFLAERFQLDIKHIGPPLIVIYLLADVGSVGGGWLSSRLLKQGWSTNAARKTALLVCALCVVPVAAAPVVSSQWTAVLLIALAAAAHQGFSANLFTLTSDMFPRNAVASVVGIGGTIGALGGFLMSLTSGRVKDLTGSYLPMFLIAATVYVLSVLIIHALAPRLEPIRLGPDPESLTVNP
jgi:ACS family hexuronate transporter-like MFS transporter